MKPSQKKFLSNLSENRNDFEILQRNHIMILFKFLIFVMFNYAKIAQIFDSKSSDKL